MPQFKTDDMENSIHTLHMCGWSAAKDIIARCVTDTKFIKTTLDVALIAQVNRACKHTIVLPDKTKAPQLRCPWIRLPNGKFAVNPDFQENVQPKDMDIGQLIDEIERTIKGVKDSGILR